MYEQFFGLRERPFSITPNPQYVFYTDRYRATLDQLLYGLEHKEGFMLLIGPVGTGKTTLCRTLLEQLDPQKYHTALIFNPFLGATEMLQALLTEFGCQYPEGASRKELLDRLNRFLMAQLVQGRACVAIFDEAQHLSAELLEQIRVLSNLETEREKLLQIILAGQPELRERIQQRDMAQLDQRVSLRCTLAPLTEEETERYIYHRLNVAGAQGRITFKGRALKRVHRETRGIPRLINLVCDRALLAAYVEQTTQLGVKHVDQGLSSLRGDDDEAAGEAAGASGRRWKWWPNFAALLLAAGAGAGCLA